MIKGLARIEMVCGSPHTLAAFYEAALGFLRSDEPCALGAGISDSVRMRLGKQEISLIDVEPHGRPYPADVAGWSPLFQHIAIVVSDMAGAYQRLSAVSGWTPISTAGPQLLPAASGGVSAFKFRDPEGHPLELIAFAPHAIPEQWHTHSDSECLGIDHSAISIADTAKSIAFYQSLGLNQSGGSLNIGPEQEKLDNVPNAIVEVTALTPAQPTPHVELLSYRGVYDRRLRQRTNDVTATRLVFSVESRDALEKLCARHREYVEEMGGRDDTPNALLHDPDGHLIFLEIQA